MKKIGLTALALVMLVGLGAFGYNAIRSNAIASAASGTDSCCAAEEAALANASACPFTQAAAEDCCGAVAADQSQTAEACPVGEQVETKVAVNETP